MSRRGPPPMVPVVGYGRPQGPGPSVSMKLIYKNLLWLLNDVNRARNLGLDSTLAQYHNTMCAPDDMSSLIRSSDSRRTLLQLASRLGLKSDQRLREALRKDENRLVATLLRVIKSQAPLPTGLTEDDAQHFMDVLQSMLNRDLPQEHRLDARRIIRRLSEACNKLPASIFILGVINCDRNPSFGGGYADVYRAEYKGKTVALKHLREHVQGEDARTIRMKFCQEALVWQNLNNQYILPMIGIDQETFSPSLCMVLPWMGNGTIITHLKDNGTHHVNKLLWEIAQGLQYLHSQGVVHGDLRGDNILVTREWTACLSDFGLSLFSDLSRRPTTQTGSIRWMAPELIAPEAFEVPFGRTPQSDVYAFACVCLELYTGQPPFSDVQAATAVMRRVMKGVRPDRPSGHPIMSDQLWQYVKAFWSQYPASRPSTQTVVQYMAGLTGF
ncbi:kinase-like domain-containing protein [Mycena epipterygia]|nr:kinase-like domain-containing protein [Mycena epipterygia]